MTPWIKSYQSLGAHRKLKRASRALDTDMVTMVGHLHFLWWWALDNIPADGSLRHIDEWDIAEGAHWDGDPKVFVEAITKAGFIDRRPRALHNYREYGGALTEKKEKNRQRMREAREQKKAIPTPSVQRTNENVQRTNENVRDLCKARGEKSRGEKRKEEKKKEEKKKEVVDTTKQMVVAKKKHPKKSLAPLVDAFRVLSMPDPKFSHPPEQKSANVLLMDYDAETIAECWKAVEAGRWGDTWLRDHLSFQALASHQRLANYIKHDGTLSTLKPAERSKVERLTKNTRRLKEKQRMKQNV
jgi:hypothetical protein